MPDDFGFVPDTPADDIGFVPDSYNAKALAYGPIVGEHHRDAMFGPTGQPLTPEGVAISPNLEAKAGLKLGDYVEVKVDGKPIGVRRFEDRSYLKPGVPTEDVIELRDRDISGAQVSFTPIPRQDGDKSSLGFVPDMGEAQPVAATTASQEPTAAPVGIGSDVERMPPIGQLRGIGAPGIQGGIEAMQRPLIPPQYLPPNWAAKYAELVLPDTAATQVGTGALEGLSNVISGFTSPMNLAMLGTAGFGKVATKLIGGAFAAKAASEVPDLWKQFKEAQTPKEKSRIAVTALAGIALPLSVLKGSKQIKAQEQFNKAVTETIKEQPPLTDEELNAAWMPKETAQEPVQPEPPVEIPMRVKQADDPFGTDMTPVSSAVIGDLGGILSKSRAKATGRYEGASELWDYPFKLKHPTHNKIFSPRGQMPDEAAQGLYDMGLLSEPSPQAMWNAIESESRTSRSIVRESRMQPRDMMMPPEGTQEPPPPVPPPPPPAREQPPLIPPEEPVPPETLNPVKGSGAFVRSYRIDKELGDRMEGIGAAFESGALRADTAVRNLLDGLNAKQEADLGKYLVSRRLATVNPSHPQILPAEIMRGIESDPAIAKALDYYRDEIKPDVEGWRKRAGLTEEAAAGKEAEFISLIPKKLELLPVKVGNNFVSPRVLPRTTIFARAAKGLAKEYNTNLNEVLTQSYAEVIRKARVREFYDVVKTKGVAEPSNVYTPDGWRKIMRFEDLPPELRHDLTRATEVSMAPTGANKLLRDYQKFVTGTALTANPAELMNHMRRQLNLVAAKPPIGQGLLARLEVLAPYFGPKLGVFKRVVMDDMRLPSNQAILKDIFDAGGGSTRSFGHRYQSKIPGIKQLQGATQNLLFGIPKGRGVRGWDLRMRVQLEKIRRSAEGNKDPQRIREFANQIGQYGSHPDWFVRGLRTVNPYAATTVPMRITELKTLVGAPGFKGETFTRSALHRAETALRSTGGTLIALATANYLLSNKWPWENDKGHEFDLNTGVRNKEGQTVYVKLRAIAPELARPLSTLSIPELSRETTAKHPQYVSAGLTGPTNQALSLISGPGQNFALTATTGKVPYFLKRPGEAPELMDVATLKKGEGAAGVSRGLRQITRAIKGVNPFGDIFGPTFEVDVPLGLDYIEEPIRGIKPFGNIYSTSYEKKEKPSTQRSRLLRRLRKGR